MRKILIICMGVFCSLIQAELLEILATEAVVPAQNTIQQHAPIQEQRHIYRIKQHVKKAAMLSTLVIIAPLASIPLCRQATYVEPEDCSAYSVMTVSLAAVYAALVYGYNS